MQQQIESNDLIKTYSFPSVKSLKPTESVPTYILPSGVGFKDIRAGLSSYHELIIGDNPRYLIDDKYGVRLVQRDDFYLDLLFYNPRTLQEYPIATFKTYQGNDSECEEWELLDFALCWLGLMEKTKTFERLMGIALIHIHGQWVVW